MKFINTKILVRSSAVAIGLCVPLLVFAAAQQVEIKNPLGEDSLEGVIRKISNSLIKLAVPIAVIVIVYAGILYLTSGGNEKQITKAKNTLTYAIVGLAIVLIGYGFVTLVKSILDLSK